MATFLEAEKKLVFPAARRHPYYIAAPSWSRGDSAGVRALYLLCHALNRAGQSAYIIFKSRRKRPIPPDFLAPVLTEETAQYHFREGLTPILVYPEVVSGNPFQGPVVTRWILNFPGLLGGDLHYDPQEILFGYSRELAQAAGFPEHILHVPTIDTRVFHPSASEQVRRGACFYAYKYRKAFPEGPLSPLTEGATEITKGLPDSQTPQQIADLFRRSEVFYAYENTMLIFEAILCGCPAVLLPNAHLTEIIGRDELGSEGYSWGSDPEDVARAKATVGQGALNFLKTYDLFWEQLERFVDLTQQRAANTPYTTPVQRPSWWSRKLGRFLGFKAS
ncbi:MAG: hypothetical protein LWX11_08305 [Firmicutes bacterium]|nr:hypothetical protein [Bacillota bacterium]